MQGIGQTGCNKRVGGNVIVGVKDIEQSEVRIHCTDVESLKHYCEMLVPRVIRHNKAIVANQQYYVAMIVRDIQSIPYTRRRELYEGLLSDVSITGVANTLYDFADVIAEIDINKLSEYIMRGDD